MLTRKYPEFARLGPQMQMGFLCQRSKLCTNFLGSSWQNSNYFPTAFPFRPSAQQGPCRPHVGSGQLYLYRRVDNARNATSCRNTPTIQLSTLDDTYHSRGHRDNRGYSVVPQTAEMSPTVKIGSSGQWRQVVSSSSIVIADCEFPPPCLKSV